MNEQAGSRAVLGPFTPREVTLLAGALVLALASLFSFGRTRGDFAVVVLALVAPVAIGIGVVWRRTRGRARLDLLSFSLDQAAAVVALTGLVLGIGGLGGAGSFVQFFALVGAFAMCVATWGAQWVGAFRADFDDEPEVPLLRRDIRVAGPQAGWVKATTRAAADAAGHAATHVGQAASQAGQWIGDQVSNATSGFGASAGPSAATGPAEAFWFAVPERRNVVDPVTGATVFEAEPGVWWLGLRRVDDGVVVRHDDGREGVLRQVDGLELA